MRLEFLFTIASLLLSCQLASTVFDLQQMETQQEEPKWSRAYAVEEYVGFESCAKCHKQQLEKFKTTKHFRSFETLHRSAESKAICQKLGIRSVKRTARCVRCHYTPAVSASGKLKSSSGVSCENCHGASKSWVQLHNFYGDVDATSESESAEHKLQRIAQSIDLGMRHPSNVFLLARSCYGCHFVDDAELVDVTDHPAVSNDFNFIAWSQGRMRHNYFRSGGEQNVVSDIPRQRLMYVADLIAACEVTVNALDRRRDANSEFQKQLRQVLNLKAGLLKQAFERSSNPLVGRAVATVRQLADPNVSKESISAALRLIGFEFGQGVDVTGLEKLDPLLPPASSYVQ